MSASAKKKLSGSMAERADIHELYEKSVQAVDVEMDFLQETFRTLRGRAAVSFREDFCGTASAACEWVRTNSKGHAVGVDLDASVLDWGRRNRVARLPEKARARVKLLNEDVRKVVTEPVDLVCAFNFSYYCFKTREEMRNYFSRVRDALNPDGVFFLDAFGGPDASDLQKEKTKLDGFTYVWDQAVFEPVTSRIVCHIHFKFPDGSKIKKAFTYDWRLWTLPELRELLTEAGFAKVRVYWEGTDDDGEGDGVFTEHATGEPDLAWIAYLVAEK
ncbi:MAG TPA: class I SAM-dependent methyltransferase [Gammaproteobacteria bacterium]|nr:class I SAM-dependent methyltransferase [Gammaproteobacteria bacterium]